MVLDIQFDVSPILSPMDLEIKEIHRIWLDGWIAQRHYLGYAPAGARLRLAVYHNGACVGGLLFGRPSARLIDQWASLELTRMYLLDECPRNSESRCLGFAARYIKRHMPDVKQLIAYSDPSYGHLGTIYKAAGWTLSGTTAGREWHHSDGKPRRNKATGPKLKWIKMLD